MTKKSDQTRAGTNGQVHAVNTETVTASKSSGATVEKKGAVGDLPWEKKSKTRIKNDSALGYVVLGMWCLPLLVLQSDLDLMMLGYVFLLFITPFLFWCVKTVERDQKYCPWCQSINDVHALICRSCSRQPLPLQEGFDASRTTHHDHDASGDGRRSPNANHIKRRIRTGSFF